MFHHNPKVVPLFDRLLISVTTSPRNIKKIAASHSFVIAFENIQCEYYATEKFWRITWVFLLSFSDLMLEFSIFPCAHTCFGKQKNVAFRISWFRVHTQVCQIEEFLSSFLMLPRSVIRRENRVRKTGNRLFFHFPHARQLRVEKLCEMKRQLAFFELREAYCL